jgi:hypothetical protein
MKREEFNPASGDLLQNVAILVPLGSANLSNFLDSPERLGEDPFSDRRKSILGSIAQAILRDRVLRSSPEAVALAFWLRRTNLEQLQADFFAPLNSSRKCVLSPVGLVFHIAPANVDTMFIYSWALSFLCGNTNIVRLSSQESPIVSAVIAIINRILGALSDLSGRDWFIRYSHADEITALLSDRCSLRIIWGGDETVRQIRRVPLNAHASERAFASKYSFAVINLRSFLDGTQAVKNKLAADFLNDVIPFDQMGCSSPHLVFWAGDFEGWEQGAAEFDHTLETVLGGREPNIDIAEAVQRRNRAFFLAAEGLGKYRFDQRGIATLLHKPNKPLRRVQYGGRVLVHSHIANLEELDDFVDASVQTLAHFGFSEDELRYCGFRLGRRGLDRIVRIGGALAFSPAWDGHNLISDLLAKVWVSA